MSVIRILQVTTLAAVSLLQYALPATADVYCVQPLKELTIVEGQWPDKDSAEGYSRFIGQSTVFQPYAVLDGEGEIYVSPDSDYPTRGWITNGEEITSRTSIAIRCDQPRVITGTLYVPKHYFGGMVALKFSIDAEQSRQSKQKDFLQAKLLHYQLLMDRGVPGAAWFRHQVRQTRGQLGQEAASASTANQRSVFRRRDSMERTYDLVSGGRAVSENLQLDRLLPEAKAEEPTVAIDSIKGITIQAFDWKKRIEKAEPARDPLAKYIPDDQYVILLPSFQAMIDLADNASEQGTLVQRATESRAEDARVRERYERQLGLGLSQIARKLGPVVIQSVAITGADPYLRTGADLAVLFEAENPDMVHQFVKAQVALAAGQANEKHAIEGTIAGVAYSGFRSPDRSLCSYIASFGNAVVVTNSPTQLKQLVLTWKNERPSLDALDEYTFFRNRYPLGAADETGLLILSDNTIRKWCGPRWRIATSRRTRAAAMMAEMQAAQLDGLVHGKVNTGPLHTDHVLPDAGSFSLGPNGVQSSVYGTLEFLTPIVEMDFTQVTESEAEFYERWRRGYERNWSNFFDPIAVQFLATPEKLGFDLTVMPLIDFSDYRRLVAISRGAKIDEFSGDPHAESLAHVVLALNTESEELQRGANMASVIANVNLLSWIGESVALYVDNDSYWAELAKIEEKDKREDFMRENVSRIPVGANIEVKSSFKLIVFLTGVRAFIDQSAPGMTVWEKLEYKKQPYVRVSPSEQAKSQSGWDEMAIYYAASGEALTLAFSEEVLKRAIDRQIERRENRAANRPISRSGLPWLGENLAMTINGGVLKTLHQIFGEHYHQHLQLSCWANLAILNEWRARYPGQDPLEVHQRYWHRKLVCPGGGEYRWNEDWQTMESTVYGHPGEPRMGAELPAALQSITSGTFGQTFEENGLRVRAELTREKPSVLE